MSKTKQQATHYAVGDSLPKAPRTKVAVFVAHGMGQQIPFQTLDQVADGLRRLDVKKGCANPKPVARTIIHEEKPLQRIELLLKGGSAAVEVHIYEAYWAPLTEGRITTRDVIRFLANAGQNGVRNASGQFNRWLFGKYERYPTPIRVVVYLLVALAVIAALVAMNSAIVLVSAGRALLAEQPRWLTNGLFADLTTTFNAVVTAMAVFGLSLGIASAIRESRLPSWARLRAVLRIVRPVWAGTTVALFVATIFIVILAGLSIALLFYGHVRGVDPESRVLHGVFDSAAIEGFNTGFDMWAWRLGLLAAVLIGGWLLVKIIFGFVRDLTDPPGRWLTGSIAILFVALVLSVITLAWALVGAFPRSPEASKGIAVARSGLAWPLLLAASVYIRRILVQYVGDVAIYVAAHKLDAFSDLRKEIKSCVYRVARAVYMLRQPGKSPEYERVIIVGHSLGSVLAYDVLNQLILEDEAGAQSMNVAGRTRLLLTFGSPLDKTAFIFAVQGESTTEAREAVVASMQPLIRDYRYRPRHWINIYSPWDIISGNLGFYDPPDSAHAKRVRNEIDPGATTLLAAHTEYWRSPVVFERVYAAI